MYTEPDKYRELERYDRRDIECSMREGHSCPVFWHYSQSTETIEPRRSGRCIPHEVMFKVARRDDYKCQLCFKPVRDDEIEFDHVIPVAKGGPTTVANIRLLCRDCNRTKGDSTKDLLKAQLRARFSIFLAGLVFWYPMLADFPWCLGLIDPRSGPKFSGPVLTWVSSTPTRRNLSCTNTCTAGECG